MINGAAPCMPGSGAAGGGRPPGAPPRSPPGRQQVPGTARSAAPAAGVQGQGIARAGLSFWDAPVWGWGVENKKK